MMDSLFIEAAEGDIQPRQQVHALIGFVANFFGGDQFVLLAGKFDAVDLLNSGSWTDQLAGLRRILYEDPTVTIRSESQAIESLQEVYEAVSELVALRSIEDTLEQKVAEKMTAHHEDFVRRLRLETLLEEQGAESYTSLQKLKELEQLQKRTLENPLLQRLRPHELFQVVGQNAAIDSLLSKLGTPYPQHVILYGPPGVGKTTVARLVLESLLGQPFSVFQNEAPFVEVDATTLRWDPRDMVNPLLGSVHDPIYQGARKDIGGAGIPEPKLGLVTKASGGILFLDEIGELDPLLQNKLLKVLEDKRVLFESSYFDPNDERVPEYIRRLFTEGAPADFVLVGATTRQPHELAPALRSRCSEVFFEPLGAPEVERIVIEASDRLSIRLKPDAAKQIATVTSEGRQAVRLLADAYGRVVQKQWKQSGEHEGESLQVVLDDVVAVTQQARLRPYLRVKARPTGEVGCAFGVGVQNFTAQCLEVEAVLFPLSQGKRGDVRFNQAAGDMAKDSVFNAVSVVRKLLGINLEEFDIHINLVGGGQVDGPSAGSAIVMALISAATETPIPGDIVFTGEVSIQGKLRAVGGVPEKVFGALQAGMKTIFVPAENLSEAVGRYDDIEVVGVETVSEVIEHLWGASWWT